MYKLIMVLALISLNAFGSRAQFIPFLDSLEQRLVIDSGHLLVNVTDHIRAKKAGFLFSRNAEASYHPLFNSISLKKDYLIRERGLYRIKSYEEFSSGGSYNPFSSLGGTIFHELAHADFDVYLEENKRHYMYKLLTDELPSWFKTHFPRVNAKTATHELFGYTAGDFFYRLNDSIETILMNHGLYTHQEKCFSKIALKKIAMKNGISLVNPTFVDILQAKPIATVSVPDYIFINGNEINVKALPQKFKESLIRYFVETYGFPKDTQELISKLNSSFYLDKLKNCYL
ncbi:MAG: hypothetical protein QF441_03420 [Bacteriovoracaceae bacterium]|nr:hypothetical protein [Bacteriovoracaceae bacterium]